MATWFRVSVWLVGDCEALIRRIMRLLSGSRLTSHNGMAPLEHCSFDKYIGATSVQNSKTYVLGTIYIYHHIYIYISPFRIITRHHHPRTLVYCNLAFDFDSTIDLLGPQGRGAMPWFWKNEKIHNRIDGPPTVWGFIPKPSYSTLTSTWCNLNLFAFEKPKCLPQVSTLPDWWCSWGRQRLLSVVTRNGKKQLGCLLIYNLTTYVLMYSILLNIHLDRIIRDYKS